MLRASLRTSIALASAIAALGCGSDPRGAGAGERCEPGSHAPCVCQARLGSRRCLADGTLATGCQCRAEAVRADTRGAAGSSNSAGSSGNTSAPAANGGRMGSAGRAGSAGNDAGSGVPPASEADGSAGTPGENGALNPPLPVDAAPRDRADDLFDPTQLRTYDIVIAESDLAAIDAQPMAEAWAPASLEFEGQTYGPLMVRYKGAAGSFMYPCTQGAEKTGKCSLKLGFDEVDPEARFHGLRKLNFHSMQADRSLLRERLGYALFREMGIAAPRAVHARVTINGQLEGLFAVVEQVDGRFTRARFGEGGEGNLYKEIWPIYSDADAYLNALETNEDEQPSVQAMLDFSSAIERGADDAASFLDLDYTLRFIAVDRVTVNDDGIFRWWCDHTAIGNNRGPAGNHNYYWYEARDASRLWLIPWDLDKSFANTPEVHIDPAWNAAGTCACNSHPEYGIQRPASCDALTRHFASWQLDYERAVDEFLAGPFAAERVDAQLSAWVSQIQPAVAESAGRLSAPSEQAWSDAVMELRAKIDTARANRGFKY